MAARLPVLKMREFSFLEFFAGAGMARAGLGGRWECLFANDFDAKKATTYQRNWGSDKFHCGDIHQLTADQLPMRTADLAWASFPCQDLSLAGWQAGLRGNRSGAFWGFWNLIETLREESRNPRLIVLENVTGAVTSNGGRDFRQLLDTMRDGGYRTGALVIDAVHFVPQSRPRLFIIGIRADQFIPAKLHLPEPLSIWSSVGLSAALRDMDFMGRPEWISWRLPLPSKRTQAFSDVIDEVPEGVRWHTNEETAALLNMMSQVNLDKVRKAQLVGRRIVGSLYKRTRVDDSGVRRQRAEVRFDEIAGCLRTPGGGSSRQTILVVHGKRVRSRLLSPREAARLMGISEQYSLPENYNEAYHLMGDGVAVPVVRHLAQNLLEPLIRAQSAVHAAVA